jgi:hypothetical protein
MLPEQLANLLSAWQEETEGGDDSLDAPLLQLLLDHGARCDLQYPSGLDMLEVASIAGSAPLLELLLRQQPFSSMKEGTWTACTEEPAAGAVEAAAAAAGGAGAAATRDTSSVQVLDSSSGMPPAGTGSTSSSQEEVSRSGSSPVALRRVNHVSRPLTRALMWCDDNHQLVILDQGWSPKLHPKDAGDALLHACETVRLAVARTAVWHHIQRRPCGPLLYVLQVPGSWLQGARIMCVNSNNRCVPAIEK